MASRFHHSRRTRSRAYDGAHNTSGHIDKIIVHKPEKINGQRTIHIDIQFRFIGSFTVPQIETLPTAEQCREEERKAKERERNHAKYLRRKEKQLALRQTA